MAIELEEKLEETTDIGNGGYELTVFNNETNSYEEVINILMLALEIDEERAFMHTWDIDHYGMAVVYTGSKEQCEERGKIISSIGIKTEVSQC